jgi:predicted MPP superfamily phosphohydrolase
MKHSHIVYFLAVALFVYAAINYYVLKRTSQALDGAGAFRTVVLWGMCVLALLYPAGRIADRFFPAGITDAALCAGSLYLAVLFYGVLCAALLDLARLGNRAFFSFPLSASAGRVAWTAAAIIIVSIVIAGNRAAMRPRLRTMDLDVAKNAAGLKELSVVAVTDMHLGAVVGVAQLQRILLLIASAKPDIVLFGGDIFDEDVSDDMEREIARVLSGIKAPYGVYAVTGNHEYYAGVEKAVLNLTRGNVTVLQDTAVEIAGAFVLIGRKDLTARRMGTGRKPLEEICRGVDRALPLILMDHQPFHLEAAQENGIDLQVSGHTHNAQLFPLNLFYGLIYEKPYGFLRKGTTNIVVSCGAGTWGPPVRTNSVSEVVRIRLHFTK